MRVLSEQEARAWCADSGIEVTQHRFLRFAGNGPEYSFRIEPATKPEQLIYFSNHFLDTWESERFNGAMLWFREWGIWSDAAEELGWKTIELMRASYGVMGAPTERPAQLFDSHELRECQAFTIQPMLIGWDAFLISAPANFFVFISHDGYYDVVSRDKATDERLFEQFSSAKPHRLKAYAP